MDYSLMEKVKTHILQSMLDDPESVQDIYENFPGGHFYTAIDVENHQEGVCKLSSIAVAELHMRDESESYPSYYSYWKRDLAKCISEGGHIEYIGLCLVVHRKPCFITSEEAELFKVQFDSDHEISKYLFNLIKTMEM